MDISVSLPAPPKTWGVEPVAGVASIQLAFADANRPRISQFLDEYQGGQREVRHVIYENERYALVIIDRRKDMIENISEYFDAMKGRKTPENLQIMEQTKVSFSSWFSAPAHVKTGFRQANGEIARRVIILDDLGPNTLSPTAQMTIWSRVLDEHTDLFETPSADRFLPYSQETRFTDKIGSHVIKVLVHSEQNPMKILLRREEGAELLEAVHLFRDKHEAHLVTKIENDWDALRQLGGSPGILCRGSLGAQPVAPSPVAPTTNNNGAGTQTIGGGFPVVEADKRRFNCPVPGCGSSVRFKPGDDHCTCKGCKTIYHNAT